MAHERFQVRRGKVEEHQSTTAQRADRRLQKLLTWETESPGNLLHIDHYGTAAERARRRLARLDPIADNDEDDDTLAPAEDELRSEESDAPNETSNSSGKSVSQPDPYCAVPLDCPGYDCNLRVSVVASLLAAWTTTREAARRWIHARDQGLWSHCDVEATLRAWLRQPPAAAFAEDLRVALLSVRRPERHPHLSNASVAFQPSELAGLGYSAPTVVLHWILSPELLPLTDNGTPVCSADRAWRFGCVPPCLLGASTCSADFPSDNCALSARC